MAQNRQGFTRREFVQTAIGSSLALGGSGLGTALAADAKPNVIFILADDMGYADVSCFGRRDYQTPNIDRLAKEGLKLPQSYANSANCSPTRFGLITGRYQQRLAGGLWEPLTLAAEKDVGLPPTHPTLPSLFKGLGYGTTLVGKWHLGTLPKFGPLKSGYDHYFGILGGEADYFKHGPKDEGPLYEDDVTIDKVGYLTNLLADRAIETISAHAKSKQPFFMSLHFTAPHYPWEGPADEAAAKQVHHLDHWDGGTIKIYGSMVQSLDANIGRVLKALEANKIAGNTIVVFTSDNGGERFSDMWPFIGKKGELLEGGIRVPNIMRWPGKIKAGSVSEQVNISMDWLPTLLAAAGGAPDPAYPSDGENLLPVFMGKAPAHERKLYWRFRVGSQRAIRDGNWKYVRLWGNEYLFDVGTDQRERANLKNSHQEVLARLKKDWETWNGTMLPELGGPVPFRQTGDRVADRPALTNPQGAPAAAPAPAAVPAPAATPTPAAPH
jgi:arylsulfatase A-like enzyme